MAKNFRHELPPEDVKYLELALSCRNKVIPPLYSNFRVHAVITYTPLPSQPTYSQRAFLLNPIALHHPSLFSEFFKGGEKEEGWVKRVGGDNEEYITGANAEIGFIGGAICAERSAFVKFRELPGWVRKVYIVSDSETFLSPGTLCREFMLDYAEPTTPIIMASEGGDYQVTSLVSLFPHPLPYLGLKWCDVGNGLGEGLVKKLGTVEKDSEWFPLFDKAIAATQQDDQDHIFALRMACAVQFSDKEIITTHQTKALEYGSTLDPLSKLFFSIENKIAEGHTLQKILITDQYGLIHAPFAQARALLVEGQSNTCWCLGHKNDDKKVKYTDKTHPLLGAMVLAHSMEEGKLVERSVRELVKFSPELFV
eukprot:CAMPEP_0201522978 /NCGR_PEP_ID=MMETSP0161_2-20130828/18675_1 /ASSEMBLY_ACC=CAM_ASM_000251 /TAXON_ID=180227 /ORGANISM="Neoparamoeba aestuarina, Strain SoJaBio B1-5/56/2" /LENGTH=366 /DNA_ID=CAMNT_0047921965 /DNA_START=28 /DNA_END=1128 /DNA_ORIENTATION=+